MPNESGKQSVLHKKHVARLQRERQQSRIILYVFIGILTTVILLLGYGYLDINYFQLNRPVAKVGETNIIAKDFEARVKLQRQQLLGQYSQLASLSNQYQQFAQSTGMDLTQQIQQFASQAQQIQGTLDTPETLGQSVLDQMINEEIIRQESVKRGITVSKAEIEDLKKGLFQYYPDGTPTPTVTPTQFNTPEIPAEAFTIVTMTPTPLPTLEFTTTPEVEAATTVESITNTPTATLEPTATQGPTSTPEPTATPYTSESFDQDYKDAVERLNKLGLKGDVYSSLFEIQVLEKKLKDVIAADITPTETQVWARHILVADEAAALVVIEKLKNGEDFATLAMELSTDTGSAVSGGDLGWFGKGAMVAEFETAAYALEKPGDFTTTPVQSQFGFHIIQLIAKQERPLTAEQYETARDTAFRAWLETAKTEYAVETFDLWKEHVPSEPNFITIATDSANQQLTAVAEEKEAKKNATATPK